MQHKTHSTSFTHDKPLKVNVNGEFHCVRHIKVLFISQWKQWHITRNCILEFLGSFYIDMMKLAQNLRTTEISRLWKCKEQASLISGWWWWLNTKRGGRESGGNRTLYMYRGGIPEPSENCVKLVTCSWAVQICVVNQLIVAEPCTEL